MTITEVKTEYGTAYREIQDYPDAIVEIYTAPDAEDPIGAITTAYPETKPLTFYAGETNRRTRKYFPPFKPTAEWLRKNSTLPDLGEP